MAGQTHTVGYRNASMADDLAHLGIELAVPTGSAAYWS